LLNNDTAEAAGIAPLKIDNPNFDNEAIMFPTISPVKMGPQIVQESPPEDYAKSRNYQGKIEYVGNTFANQINKLRSENTELQQLLENEKADRLTRENELQAELVQVKKEREELRQKVTQLEASLEDANHKSTQVKLQCLEDLTRVSQELKQYQQSQQRYDEIEQNYNKVQTEFAELVRIIYKTYLNAPYLHMCEFRKCH